MEKMLFKSIRLADNKGSFSKPWFVEYWYLNQITNKYERKRVYDGFVELKTLEERNKYAAHLIQSIQTALMQGFNPLQNPRFNWAQHIKYPGLYTPTFDTSKTVKEFLLKYAEDNRGIHKKKTTQGIESRLKTFFEFLQQKGYNALSIDQISKAVANEYRSWLKQEKHFGNEYSNNILSAVKTSFAYLIDLGTIEKNPFSGLKKLPKDRKGVQPFERHHIELLKPHLEKDPQLWLFCQFIYLTSIRPEELRKIKLKNLRFDSQEIIVSNDISKNKKNNVKFIPLSLWNKLEEMGLKEKPGEFFLFGKSGRPSMVNLSYNTFRNRHNKILRELEISSDYSLYSWKHTGLAKMNNIGVPLETIKDQASHHSYDQTSEYMRNKNFLGDTKKLNEMELF